MTRFSTAMARIVTVGMLAVIAGSVAAQPVYPTKPVRLIIPFPPGGGVDTSARMVAQKLTEALGQQVIVDNRPGGNTIIGSSALVKSPPDGYTILEVSVTHVIIPNLFPTPYDAIKDFAPVATVSSSGYILVLHPSVPANNLREFIALAKSRPGELNYATPGGGGIAHLSAELFNLMTGVKTQHIPYKGSGQILTDLIGGQVHLAFMTPSVVIAHIKTGKLKAIAIDRQTRLSVLPQLPTFTEAGLPGFDAKAWLGVLAPAGTPREIIDKLSTEIAKILALPEVKEKLIGQGLDPFYSTPDQFAALIKADLAKFAKIIKAANIKGDN